MIPPLPFSLTEEQQLRVDELLKRAEEESTDLDDLAEEEPDAVRLELYRINAERHPDSVWHAKQYGARLGNLKHHQAACDALKHALDLDPHNHHSIDQYLRALYFLERFDDILEMVAQRPEPSDDEDRARLLYWRTNALLQLERYEEALEHSREAYYLFRDHWMTFTLGYASYKTGRYEDAIGYYNDTIRLKPTFLTPYLNKACMYSLLGKYQEAYLTLMVLHDIDKAYFKHALEDEELEGVLDSEFGAELRELGERITATAFDEDPDPDED